MRKKIGVLIFTLVLMASMYGQEFNTDLWIKDTVGSNGYRVNIVNNQWYFLTNLKNVLEDSLYGVLGIPDYFCKNSCKMPKTISLLCGNNKSVIYLYENYLYREDIESFMPNSRSKKNNYSSSYIVYCIDKNKVKAVYKFNKGG